VGAEREGKILKIDLSEERWWVEELEGAVLEKFLGGRGLAVHILSKEAKGIDPLDPLNPLVIATGPLTGLMPGSDRVIVAARSPLTGMYFDESINSKFGALLRRLGYDAMVITGRASAPLYLLIDGGGVRLVKTYKLWGLSLISALRRLSERYGHGAGILAIGPAGENLVRPSRIMGEALRWWGRGGLGAIFGSKRLKAVIARPFKVAEVSEREGLSTAVKVGSSTFKAEGRLRFLEEFVRRNVLLCMNFRTPCKREGERLLYALRDSVIARGGCEGCETPCIEAYKVDDAWIEGVDYLAMATLGLNNLVWDCAEILRLLLESLNLGLDPISIGNASSWAIELFERGIIDEEFTGGLKLAYGNPRLLERLLRLTAYRKAFGALLAEGLARSSHIIGSPSQDYAVQLRGLELPSLNPFKDHLMVLAFLVSTGDSDPEVWLSAGEVECDEPGVLASRFLKLKARLNVYASLTLCPLLGLSLTRVSDLLGLSPSRLELTQEELLKSGINIEGKISRLNSSVATKWASGYMSKRLRELAREHELNILREASRIYSSLTD